MFVVPSTKGTFMYTADALTRENRPWRAAKSTANRRRLTLVAIAVIAGCISVIIPKDTPVMTVLGVMLIIACFFTASYAVTSEARWLTPHLDTWEYRTALFAGIDYGLEESEQEPTITWQADGTAHVSQGITKVIKPGDFVHVRTIFGPCIPTNYSHSINTLALLDPLTYRQRYNRVTKVWTMELVS